MSQEKAFVPRGLHRRRLLRGAAVVGGLGAGGTLGLLPRTALACHTYVSASGSKGCGAYAADLANGSLNSGGSSTSSSSGSSAGSSTTTSGSTGSTTTPPAAPSTSGNTALAFGGQYLGCPLYSASKAPNGYWDKHSYRFVAEHTGAVKTVRWENRTGTGYSVGSGGTIQLSIQTDSGGVPSGQKLGTTAAYANAASLGNFPELPFTTQPQLTYGTTYHLVFEQLTPNVGKVSVNDLHDWTPPPDGLVIFPLQKSKLASIRYENNAWRVMPGYIPIYELTYTDGVAKGQPWMDGGRGCHQNIGGGNVARQTFAMWDTSATVTGVYFAFFRNGSVGTVTIRLTNTAIRPSPRPPSTATRRALPRRATTRPCAGSTPRSAPRPSPRAAPIMWPSRRPPARVSEPCRARTAISTASVTNAASISATAPSTARAAGPAGARGRCWAAGSATG